MAQETMKIIIDKEQFSDELSELSSVVKARTTLPVLRFAHLEVQEGHLFITADDLECRLTRYVKAVEGTESVEGACLLPFKLIGEWLKQAQEGPLVIEGKDS